MIPPPPNPILSPCIGVCELGPDNLCVGCHRSIEEITRWSRMSDAERLHLMETTLVMREAARSVVRR
jgi:predicted Fe-S protein YdhL (DUF1289 family)